MDLNTKQHKTKLSDLNTTLDTTLTNLSELPSLTKPFISKNDQIVSFDLDDILNPTTSLIDDELLQDRPGGNNTEPNNILPLTKVKPISTLPPLLSTKNPSPSPDENEYEDDFEAPQGTNGFHKDNDISIGTEDLVNLSEEIDTNSFDEDDIKLDTPLLQTSELLGNESIITSDEDYTPDYNKMSETDYIKRKDTMEAKFQKQQLKPGDIGYEYDKQVNFTAPTMESGWDSDDSTESEF